MSRDEREERRRRSFGGAAERYDRARPDYPAQLVDDVIAFAGAAPGEEVLEVGVGTGKAARMFCDRGLRVLGVEPDPRMAAVASQQAATAAHNLRILVSDFEAAELPGDAFPLVYSAQAWHWVQPERGFAKAHQCLRRGGVIAAFWNRVDWTRCELRAELDDAYNRSGVDLVENGPMDPADTRSFELGEEWREQVAAAGGFAGVEVRSYTRTLRYTSGEYVELLQTHSDHILLYPDVREQLLEAVASVIDSHGGVLRLPSPTILCLARAV